MVPCSIQVAHSGYQETGGKQRGQAVTLPCDKGRDGGVWELRAWGLRYHKGGDICPWGGPAGNKGFHEQTVEWTRQDQKTSASAVRASGSQFSRQSVSLKGTNPITGAPFSRPHPNLITSRKPPPLNTITLGIRASIYELGEGAGIRSIAEEARIRF